MCRKHPLLVGRWDTGEQRKKYRPEEQPRHQLGQSRLYEEHEGLLKSDDADAVEGAEAHCEPKAGEDGEEQQHINDRKDLIREV
ncbi:hypothetical protein NDU88_006076 [Pleurodeles waltl]|uniref:Uncharacterized protein n=1 Tax=Pleurodeles waltl TaxID=8319 RepID=A0AAV7QH20_PLEWA|nr:hypothetical protein NDU88_006076 [Pleurodeles waltl]